MIDTVDTKHLHITFRIEPVQNPEKSRKENRPIYEDREMVEIKFVGDPKKVLVAPAHDKFMRDRATGEWVSYAQVYHRHYEAFKTGEAAKGEGTPLSELPWMTEARRAELRALHIHTVETLADLGDAGLTRLGMYGRADRDKARSYIEAAKTGAHDAQLVEANAALITRIAALEAQLSAGGTAQQPIVASVQAEEPASTFESWPDTELRAFIKQQTGTAPKGQPSHANLVRMAEEANAKEAA